MLSKYSPNSQTAYRHTQVQSENIKKLRRVAEKAGSNCQKINFLENSTLSVEGKSKS